MNLVKNSIISKIVFDNMKGVMKDLYRVRNQQQSIITSKKRVLKEKDYAPWKTDSRDL